MTHGVQSDELAARHYARHVAKKRASGKCPLCRVAHEGKLQERPVAPCACGGARGPRGVTTGDGGVVLLCRDCGSLIERVARVAGTGHRIVGPAHRFALSVALRGRPHPNQCGANHPAKRSDVRAKIAAGMRRVWAARRRDWRTVLAETTDSP